MYLKKNLSKQKQSYSQAHSSCGSYTSDVKRNSEASFVVELLSIGSVQTRTDKTKIHYCDFMKTRSAQQVQQCLRQVLNTARLSRVFSTYAACSAYCVESN